MTQRPQDSRDFDKWTRNPKGWANKGANQQHRLARFVVEVFTDPQQFTDKKQAREALLESLTDLARSFGVEPPDDIDAAFGIAS